MRHLIPKRNRKKPKTAVRQKRYRCAICRKKAEQAASAPYYCPKCRGATYPPENYWEYPE